MDGKIFGIPLALIVIILGLALFVVTPVALMQRQTITEIRQMRQVVNNLAVFQEGVASPSATPVTEAPVKVTPTPVKATVIRPVVTSTPAK